MEKRMEHLTETDKRGDAAAAAYEWVEAAIFALVCVVLVFTFLFRIVGVDGESMQNTLMNHDRLILTRLPYTPERGDIVVINRYTAEPLVKRVIAVEGDTIDIDPETLLVSVNGTVIDEPYLDCLTPLLGFEGPLTVGEGQVFVMGDNRVNSHDSRSSDIGLVRVKDIMGKAVFRIWPLNSIGGLY
jgi:signal peptidase I